MFHRFNERARDAIDKATKKARELRHTVVEPEHILASLADEEAGSTSFHSLLKAFDVPTGQVAESLEPVPGPAGGAQIDPVFSRDAKRVLEFAVDEADKLGHKRVGTSHFLLAFLREELEGESGARTLTSLGLSLQDVRTRVKEIAESEGAGKQDVIPSILFFELDRRARESEQALDTRVKKLEGEMAELRSLVNQLKRPAGG